MEVAALLHARTTQASRRLNDRPPEDSPANAVSRPVLTSVSTVVGARDVETSLVVSRSTRHTFVYVLPMSMASARSLK